MRRTAIKTVSPVEVDYFASVWRHPFKPISEKNIQSLSYKGYFSNYPADFVHGYLESSKSRQEIPQKLTQLRLSSHPRHLVGKKTAQKDAIKDTTILWYLYPWLKSFAVKTLLRVSKSSTWLDTWANRISWGSVDKPQHSVGCWSAILDETYRITWLKKSSLIACRCVGIQTLW